MQQWTRRRDRGRKFNYINVERKLLTPSMVRGAFSDIKANFSRRPYPVPISFMQQKNSLALRQVTLVNKLSILRSNDLLPKSFGSNNGGECSRTLSFRMHRRSTFLVGFECSEIDDRYLQGANASSNGTWVEQPWADACIRRQWWNLFALYNVQF